MVYYWGLSDLLEPMVLGNANSSIAKYKVDCGEEKQIWLNHTWYSQSMGRGTIISEFTPNEIQYPKPNTVAQFMMKYVCDYAR